MVEHGLPRGFYLVLAVLLCLGCSGEKGEPTYEVTGVVTLNDTPIEGATVTFIPPPGGRGAVGVTDASGRYKLTTDVRDDGARVGQYKVTVAKYESQSTGAAAAASEGEYTEGSTEDAPPAANVLPRKYADPSSSGFEANVVAGSNTFDFKLAD